MPKQKSQNEQAYLHYAGSGHFANSRWSAGRWWTLLSWSACATVVFGVVAGFSWARGRVSMVPQDEGAAISYLFVTFLVGIASLIFVACTVIAALWNPKDRAYWRAIIPWIISFVASWLPIGTIYVHSLRR